MTITDGAKTPASTRDLEGVRLAIGWVAAGVLMLAAAFVYTEYRSDTRPMDWTVFFVLVGFFGGTLFYLVDPTSKQEFRWRKIANLGGAAATGTVLMLVAHWLAVNPPSAFVAIPVNRKVILLDSDISCNVYDKDRREYGGTNSDEIKGVLATIPNVALSARRINPAWSDAQELRDEAPELIVMHYSSFRDADGQNSYQDLLKTFLGSMAPSQRTRFLIYSRQFRIEELEKRRAELETADARLKGRIEVFAVLSGSFMKPTTAANLRGTVQRLLEVAPGPNKPLQPASGASVSG